MAILKGNMVGEMSTLMSSLDVSFDSGGGHATFLLPGDTLDDISSVDEELLASLESGDSEGSNRVPAKANRNNSCEGRAMNMDYLCMMVLKLSASIDRLMDSQDAMYSTKMVTGCLRLWRRSPPW